MQLISADEADTRTFGARLAPLLEPGDCIDLRGELGAGKTVFTKGLAAGRGLDPDQVTSPSFTLVHLHVDPQGVELVHADGFRVGGAADAESLGLRDLTGGILVVEWGDRLQEELPSDRLQVTLTTGRQGRQRILQLEARGRRSEAILRAFLAALSGGPEERSHEERRE